GEKHVKAVFSLGSKISPSAVFVDEVLPNMASAHDINTIAFGVLRLYRERQAQKQEEPYSTFSTDKVGNSLQHWDNTKLAINRFNERNMVEIESFIRETIQVNNLSEEIAAAYVSMDTKFQSDASDIKSCVNGNLC
ncbi:hypothetical protein Tco_1096251, partial [Tanacetum coccineum]